MRIRSGQTWIPSGPRLVSAVVKVNKLCGCGRRFDTVTGFEGSFICPTCAGEERPVEEETENVPDREPDIFMVTEPTPAPPHFYAAKVEMWGRMADRAELRGMDRLSQHARNVAEEYALLAAQYEEGFR